MRRLLLIALGLSLATGSAPAQDDRMLSLEVQLAVGLDRAFSIAREVGDSLGLPRAAAFTTPDGALFESYMANCRLDQDACAHDFDQVAAWRTLESREPGRIAFGYGEPDAASAIAVTVESAAMGSTIRYQITLHDQTPDAGVAAERRLLALTEAFARRSDTARIETCDSVEQSCPAPRD